MVGRPRQTYGNPIDRTGHWRMILVALSNLSPLFLSFFARVACLDAESLACCPLTGRFCRAEFWRRCVHRSQPYGSDHWVKRMAVMLGLESTLRRRSRPKKRSRIECACPLLLFDRCLDASWDRRLSGVHFYRTVLGNRTESRSDRGTSREFSKYRARQCHTATNRFHETPSSIPTAQHTDCR
jgi:hypothetical protein